MKINLSKTLEEIIGMTALFFLGYSTLLITINFPETSLGLPIIMFFIILTCYIGFIKNNNKKYTEIITKIGGTIGILMTILCFG